MEIDIIAILKEFSVSIFVTLVITTILTILIITRFSVRNVVNSLRKGNACHEVGMQEQESTFTSPKTESSETANENTDELPVQQDSEQTTCSPRYPDPVDYCEHIQGEIKRVQQSVATRSIVKHLTEDQLKEEREVQRKQLAEIFKLMQEQQDRFGIGSMDDMQEQMKLYAI